MLIVAARMNSLGRIRRFGTAAADALSQIREKTMGEFEQMKLQPLYLDVQATSPMVSVHFPYDRYANFVR